jgi:hypothetical protein
MQPLARPQRLAVGLWLVVALVVWNGVYDFVVMRGVKEFLFRQALYEAGRGPQTAIAMVMDSTVFDAVWIASIWASVILLAGLFTIRLLSRPRG